MRLALCLVLTLLLLPAAALAQVRFDPRLDWRTLETEHFLVHFHDGLEQTAVRAGEIAEEAHRQLTAELGWEPAARTHLVLADVTDAPNGLATPFPYNRMVIFLTPPLEQPFSLTDREEWLRVVIVHEYTHILHLDTVRRLPAVLRRVFGRVYFPNALQPQWIIEGLATYQESRFSEGGRGRAAYTDMVLRMAVLEHRFPTPAQAAIFLDSWPAGETPYLFGAAFFAHLAQKHGEDLPRRMSHDYAGRALPFFVESSARATIGSSIAPAWRNWQSQLTRRYLQQKRDIEAQGLTPYERLTVEGYRHLAPAVSPSGRLLAFSAQTADRTPHLMLLPSPGGEPEALRRRLVTPAAAGIAWLADDAGLVYAKLERDRYDNLFHDLFRLDLASGREERLTHGLRAGAPDLSPAGDRLVFTIAGEGRYRLATADARAGEVRLLHPAEDRRDFFSPRWSPEGERIAAAVREPDGTFAVLVLNAAGKPLQRLALAGVLHGGPAWHPDGSSLFFSADRGGVFNLYAWRPADGALFQVSNVLGGAFSPAVAPDGETLYFTAYSSAGFDLARMPLNPEAWLPVTEVEEAPPAPTPSPRAAPATRDYRLGGTLLPRWWLPWFGGDEDGLQVGLITSAHDPLQRHSYLLTALYGAESGRGAYSLLYQYQGLLPTVQAFASDQAVFYDDFFRPPGRPERDFWERRRSAGLDLVVPFPGLWSRHSLVPGYRWERFDNLTPPPFGEAPPEEGDLSSLRLAWLFADTVRPPRGISPDQGRRLQLAAEASSRDLGSDFSRRKYTLDWHEFISFPWKHHVLATRLFGGLAEGDVLAQRAFKVGGDVWGDFLQGLDGEYLPLRGYKVNAFRGQRAVLASLEYRFPLANFERGPGNGFFFFRRLHGAVFGEGAQAFDRGGLRRDEFRTAAGAEARLDADLAWFLPVTFRLVFAHGFDEDGETQGYLSLWLRF